VNSSQFPVLSSQGSLVRRDVRRWVKFNLVGGLGVAVQLAALSILHSLLKIDYLPATGLAVEIAVIHNFLWHERFTWVDRPAQEPLQSLGRLLKFNASNGAVSLIGNVLLMRVLVGVFGCNVVASNVAAIVLCSLVNFLLSDRFVFGEAPDEASRFRGDFEGSRR